MFYMGGGTAWILHESNEWPALTHAHQAEAVGAWASATERMKYGPGAGLRTRLRKRLPKIDKNNKRL